MLLRKVVVNCFQNVSLIYRTQPVPEGTRVSHQTACGIDPNYHFVCEFDWIFKNYPMIAYMLKHDVKHYGINVPKEYVTKE